MRDDYGAHAPDLDTIWAASPESFKCPICGGQMYPYRDKGSYGIVRCKTPFCPNNPDYEQATKLYHNDIYKYEFLNNHRILREFYVRRLV